MLLDVFRVRLSFCVCAECILFTKYIILVSVLCVYLY